MRYESVQYAANTEEKRPKTLVRKALEHRASLLTVHEPHGPTAETSAG